MIKQYFESNFTNEWDFNNRLFRRVKFTPTNNVKVQSIWARNEGTTQQEVTFGVDGVHTALNPTTGTNGINTWVKFGTSENNITNTSITVTLDPNESFRYFIQITIPRTILTSPNAATRFPVGTLNFTTYEHERDVTTKFYSYISYELTPSAIHSAIPNGIVIINSNQEVIAVTNNINKKFDFGYNRAGGNDDFTLSLRANWDQEIGITRPIQYDDQILFVQDGQIWYRGVINRIRTKLDSEESQEITGSGLVRQLSGIIVNDRFREVSIKNIIITLMQKYLTGMYSPIIQYDVNNIEDIATTRSIEFKNETLHSCIEKLASIAGANPTGEGSTGNDIIWGVDHDAQFYFKKKSTALAYQFQVGKDIKLDDPQVAPRFNRIKLIGNSSGRLLHNYIPDGACELTQGSKDIGDFQAYWRVDPSIVVEAISIRKSNESIDLTRVARGSQAYKFPIDNFTISTGIAPADSEDHTKEEFDLAHSKTFGTQWHAILANKTYRLSFYAKTEEDKKVTIEPTVMMSSLGISRVRRYGVVHGQSVLNRYIGDIILSAPRTDEFTLTGSFRRYVTKPFKMRANNLLIEDDPLSPLFRVFFPVNSYGDTVGRDEKITIDNIYMYQEKEITLDDTEENVIDETQATENPNLPLPDDTLNNNPDLERAGFSETTEEYTNIENITTKRKYRYETFASDGEYEIIIEDSTGVEEFGRIKEITRQVDSLNRFPEAYEYAKALLGESANQAHRATLTLINNKDQYQPYDREKHETLWGHTRVFGSQTKRTQYEYAVVSVKHSVINDTLNTTLGLGAPRPEISEIVRSLTARERYQGETTGGGGGTGPTDQETGVGEGNTIIVQRDMPSSDTTIQLLENATGDTHPIWIVAVNQTNSSNRASVEIKAEHPDFYDLNDTEITEELIASTGYRLAAGTKVVIRSAEDFRIVSIPSDSIEQVQSNWSETDEESPAFIQNKPEPVEQVQSNWRVSNENSQAFIKNKPDLGEIPLYVPGQTVPPSHLRTYRTQNGIYGIFFSHEEDDGNLTPNNSNNYINIQTTPQVKSDWDETDEELLTFIENKPEEVEQVQSDWDEDDQGSPAFIENKPEEVEQVQSDWDEDDQGSPAFIENKPEEVEQVQSDWDETDEESLTFIENKPEEVEQVQSDWDETDEESLTFIENKPDEISQAEQVQSDWDEDDQDSPAFIENKPDEISQAEQVQSDWEEADRTLSAFVKNKPPPGEVPLYAPGIPITTNRLRAYNNEIYFTIRSDTGETPPDESQNYVNITTPQFRTVGNREIDINIANRWRDTTIKIPTTAIADWIIINTKTVSGNSYSNVTPRRWINVTDVRALPSQNVGASATPAGRIEIETRIASENKLGIYLGRTSSQNFLLTTSQVTQNLTLDIQRLVK